MKKFILTTIITTLMPLFTMASNINPVTRGNFVIDNDTIESVIVNTPARVIIKKHDSFYNTVNVRYMYNDKNDSLITYTVKDKKLYIEPAYGYTEGEIEHAEVSVIITSPKDIDVIGGRDFSVKTLFKYTGITNNNDNY